MYLQYEIVQIFILLTLKNSISSVAYGDCSIGVSHWLLYKSILIVKIIWKGKELPRPAIVKSDVFVLILCLLVNQQQHTGLGFAC